MRCITTIICFFIFSQTCAASIYLWNQEQVDSFRVNHPNNFIDEAIRIEGLSIVNLDSLSHIDSIQGNFSIRGTSLVDLKGLENLEWVYPSFAIFSNEQLTDLSALSNLKYVGFSFFLADLPITEFPLVGIENTLDRLTIELNENLVSLDNLNALSFDYLTIRNNENLSFCSIISVCSHISSFKNVNISCNGSGCSSTEEIWMSCNLFESCENNGVILEENFDDWNINDLPDNMEFLNDSLVNTLGTIYSYQLNNDSIGNKEIQLNVVSDFGYSLENNMIIKIDNQNLNSVDVSFEYCFQELQGNTISAAKGELRVDDLLVWNTGLETNSCLTFCPLKRSVQLCNLPVSQSVDDIEVGFRNESLISAVDGSFTSGWVLDNISITNSEISDAEDLNVEQFKISPNPTSKVIKIPVELKDLEYVIFNNNSQIVQKGILQEEIVLNFNGQGLFYLVAMTDKKQIFERFIKF